MHKLLVWIQTVLVPVLGPPGVFLVSFLDSSGLHALVHARESAGPRLRLGTVNPAVRRVLEMTALLGHLGRDDDPTDSS